MISKKIFEDVCNNAKIKLDYEGKDFAEINGFLTDIISGIDKINIDEDIGLLDLELVNTFREDIARPSLKRAEVLSTTEYIEAGCVNIPVNLREE